MHKPQTVRPKPILPAILAIALMLPLHAEQKSVTLGGASGWPALSVSRAISRAPGRLGREALVLSTALPSGPDVHQTPPAGRSVGMPAGETTDLYLSFDASPVTDLSGNYAVVSSPLLSSAESQARRGRSAGLCNTVGKGLLLRGRPGTLFASPGESGSFSIEFWIFPVVTENGSILFQWRSSRTTPAASIYQYIRASMFRNHIEWNFSNIWATSSGSPVTVTISGRRNLIPGIWSHHLLSYDAESGLLEYSLDGSTEEVRYITSTGHESGDVYPAILGSAADLEIASRFSGLMDEFRILRRPVPLDTLEEKHAVTRVYPGAGRFESMPIDSGRLNSSLLGITAVTSGPPETGTAFFVRGGDNFYTWTDSEPAWISVRSGQKISGLTGRYFQVAGELYSDGKGSLTPTVSSVTVNYEEDSPPWPPARVFVSAGDCSVDLSWVASIDYDAAGYLVYYGERPGEYLGAGTPLDAGKALNYTVTGLVNGRMYYFCVAAYDDSGRTYPGNLSGEVYARPLAAAGR